jgi:hypothetical protein
MNDTPLWRQFRRLLLGAVVEGLLEAGILVDFPTIRIQFHDTSVFNVPRLDNYMRFHGVVTAQTLSAPTAAHLHALRTRLGTMWPELLSAIELPIGDSLQNEHTRVTVSITDTTVTIQFDFAAD